VGLVPVIGGQRTDKSGGVADRNEFSEAAVQRRCRHLDQVANPIKSAAAVDLGTRRGAKTVDVTSVQSCRASALREGLGSEAQDRDALGLLGDV